MVSFKIINTILIIEGYKDIRENLTKYLKLEGYNILFINDGKEGVELAKELVPDLIGCDVLMSEMDGYEVLQLHLGTSKTQEIPFIFSASNFEKVERTVAFALGADD